MLPFMQKKKMYLLISAKEMRELETHEISYQQEEIMGKWEQVSRDKGGITRLSIYFCIQLALCICRFCIQL